VEVPASVEVMAGFSGCGALTTIIFAAGSRIREMRRFRYSVWIGPELDAFVDIKGFQQRVFLIYQDEKDLRQKRRGLHLTESLPLAKSDLEIAIE
jgi:hypothetical protein